MQVRSYISERKREREHHRRFIFACAAALIVGLAATGVAWLVIVSPMFRVSRVVVQGNDDVSADAVVSLVEATAMPKDRSPLHIDPILGYGSLLAWPSRVPADMLARIPQLKSLAVSRDYFSRTVTITVAERDPLAIWCFTPQAGAGGDEQCYWFDETGLKFQRTYDTEGGAIEVVHDYSQKPTPLGAPVLPERFLPNLVSIIGLVRSAHVDATGIALNDLDLEEVTVATVHGPSLYFSLRFPADDYLQTIQGLMNQPNWSTLAYVDCRTENRVYYK